MRKVTLLLLSLIVLSLLADDVIVIQRRGGNAYAINVGDVDSIYFCNSDTIHDSPANWETIVHDTIATSVVTGDNWHYNIEPPVVADYINSVDYSGAEDDYSYTKITDYITTETDNSKQHHAGVPVTWNCPAGNQKIILSYQIDSLTCQDTINVPDTVSRYIVDNLYPGKRYDYRVISSDSTVRKSHFFTVGQVRMINLPSITNVRDLGGWRTVDGKTVRYGLIYRGAELNRPSTLYYVANHQISSDDSTYMVDKMKIRLELDLRDSHDMALDDTDRSNNMNHTELGDSVEYYNQMVHYYTSYIKEFTYRMRWGRCISKIIKYIKQGKAVYAHCTWGADRTGVLSMLILGTLGVSQSDIDKEYELTAFYRSRSRSASEVDYWSGNMAYIKSLSGTTLKDKFASYLRLCGITSTEINDLRTCMLE